MIILKIINVFELLLLENEVVNVVLVVVGSWELLVLVTLVATNVDDTDAGLEVVESVFIEDFVCTDVAKPMRKFSTSNSA